MRREQVPPSTGFPDQNHKRRVPPQTFQGPSSPIPLKALIASSVWGIIQEPDEGLTWLKSGSLVSVVTELFEICLWYVCQKKNMRAARWRDWAHGKLRGWACVEVHKKIAQTCGLSFYPRQVCSSTLARYQYVDCCSERGCSMGGCGNSAKKNNLLKMSQN